jgi:hypothetical protein
MTTLNCLHCGQRTQLCKDGTYRSHAHPGCFPKTLCSQSRKPFSPCGTRFTVWHPEGDSSVWRASCQCGSWEHPGVSFGAVRDAWAVHAGFSAQLDVAPVGA